MHRQGMQLRRFQTSFRSMERCKSRPGYVSKRLEGSGRNNNLFVTDVGRKREQSNDHRRGAVGLIDLLVPDRTAEYA